MTRVTAPGISPGKKTSYLQLAHKDGFPGARLNLSRVWYIPKCPEMKNIDDMIDQLALVYKNVAPKLHSIRLNSGLCQ